MERAEINHDLRNLVSPEALSMKIINPELWMYISMYVC